MKKFHKFLYGCLGILISFLLLWGNTDALFAKSKKCPHKKSTITKERSAKRKAKTKSSSDNTSQMVQETIEEEKPERDINRIRVLYGIPEAIKKQQKAEADSIK